MVFAILFIVYTDMKDGTRQKELIEKRVKDVSESQTKCSIIFLSSFNEYKLNGYVNITVYKR